MDQLSHSPNQTLAKVLALINVPFCLVALIGLPFLIYIIITHCLNGEILKFKYFFSYGIWLFILAYGFYLEYAYFQVGFKSFNPDRETAIWVQSLIFNGFTLIYWLAYYFLMKIEKAETLDGALIFFFILISAIYFYYSLKAYNRVHLPPPVF